MITGFFVDLNLFKVNKERLTEFSKENNGVVETGGDTNGASAKYGLADEDANLMIKLKFLTYKVWLMRWFGFHYLVAD